VGVAGKPAQMGVIAGAAKPISSTTAPLASETHRSPDPSTAS
jgi:hypothetical protein